MKYPTEMSSDAIIYIPSFIKIGSCIQKLIGGGGGNTQPHRQDGYRISLLLFFSKRRNVD
jgi:hypothetical protein